MSISKALLGAAVALVIDHVARAARASSAVCTKAGNSFGRRSTDRSMAPIFVVPFGRIAATAEAGKARLAGSVMTRIAATGRLATSTRTSTTRSSTSSRCVSGPTVTRRTA